MARKALVLIVALLTSALIAFSGSVALAASSESESSAASAQASPDNALTPLEEQSYINAILGDGIVTAFIGEPFYKGKINNSEDAVVAVESVMERIGGDETTRLDVVAVRSFADGVTYYSMRQRAGDVVVHGAAVQLAVDAEGNAVGLTSAIMPDVQIADLDEWAITASEAEQIVVDYWAGQGAKDLKVVKGSTVAALVPIMEGVDRFRYAWIVYSDNPDTASEIAYLANYVGADGEYLQSVPVSKPGDVSVWKGDVAPFVLDGMEGDLWYGKVTAADGTVENVTIPIARNPRTGEEYLADVNRGVLCADYYDWEYKGTLTLIAAENGKFSDEDVLTYRAFLDVYDPFLFAGWDGPDGIGTPCLLLMDMVESDGTPIDNACYCGRSWGFQVFAFGRVTPYGECLDVVAHEFTHCVTSMTMTTNLYLNDYGAINEGMSDIVGNLIEYFYEGDDGAWLMGEDSGQPIRSMVDPHAYGQPAYVWDQYYVPPASVGTYVNDNGGVHTNSSLLNMLSYRLHEAGMDPYDQLFFWMNVACAITPHTDYAQLAELLPWCMKQSGYDEYVEVVNLAVQELGYSTTELPAVLPEGCGMAKFTFPDSEAAKQGMVNVAFVPVEEGAQAITWPAAETNLVAAVLPEGDYYVAAQYYSKSGRTALYLYAEGGWELKSAGRLNATDENVVHVTAGETIELDVKGLGEQ